MDASKSDPWIRAHEVGAAAFCLESARHTRRKTPQHAEARARMEQGIVAHAQWLDRARPSQRSALHRPAFALGITALIIVGIVLLLRWLGGVY